MSISEQDIIGIVNAIFMEKFEFKAEELAPEKNLFEDLQIDSLDIVDLMMGLQQKLGVKLHDNQELREVRTLHDVYALVAKIVAEHPEAEEKLNALQK